MSDFTTPSAPSRELRQEPAAQIFRRTFSCGHPDEYIEVQREGDGEQVHNLITLEVFKEGSRAAKSRPTYTMARCLDCAKKVKDEDDKDLQLWPKRSLGAYEAGAASLSVSRAASSRQDGFDGVLERYKHRDGLMEDAKPHPRVSEEKHRTYRLDAQASARNSGKLIAVPLRRIRDAPLQQAGDLPSQTYQRAVPYAPRGEDKALSERQIDERRSNSYNGERNSALSDTISNDRPSKTSSSDFLETTDHEDIRIQDLIIMRTEIDSNDLDQFTPVHTPETSHDSPQMSVTHVRPSKIEAASRLRISRVYRATTSNAAGFLSDDETSLLSLDGHALQPQVSNTSTSSGRVSAFVEHLIDQYASPFDDSSDPPLVDLQKYKHPRPAPAPPKKRPFDFRQRRGSISTTTSNTADSISRNFRKLRLDLQHSARLDSKTEPDSDSPDWACRTSLAIEAGRISMDSVSKQSRESTSSQYASQTPRRPTKVIPATRDLAEDAGLRERRNTSPPPTGGSSEYNSIASVLGRHSEGAPEAVRRARTAYSPGRPKGMEMALEEQAPTKRRDSAQDKTLVDLNKSLPALPAPQDNKKKGEDSSWI